MATKLSVSAAVPCIVIAAAACVFLMEGASQTSGADSVRKASLDFHPTAEIANLPNSYPGKTQPCTPTVSIGGTADVDLLAYDVPASSAISGFTYSFQYNGASIQVVGVNVIDQMLGVGAGSGPFDITHDPLPDGDGDFSISADDMGSGHESGSGVLLRLTFQAVGIGDSFNNVHSGLLQVRDSSGANLPVDLDYSGQTGSVLVQMNSSCQLVLFPEICGNGVDDDGDSQADEPEPWPVPPADTDCDGFSDADETTIGTAITQRCLWWQGNTSLQWPVDFDNSSHVNISDVLALKPVFGSAVPPTSARYDIVPGGGINISDVLRLKPFFGDDCLN